MAAEDPGHRVSYLRFGKNAADQLEWSDSRRIPKNTTNVDDFEDTHEGGTSSKRKRPISGMFQHRVARRTISTQTTSASFYGGTGGLLTGGVPALPAHVSDALTHVLREVLIVAMQDDVDIARQWSEGITVKHTFGVSDEDEEVGSLVEMLVQCIVSLKCRVHSAMQQTRTMEEKMNATQMYRPFSPTGILSNMFDMDIGNQSQPLHRQYMYSPNQQQPQPPNSPLVNRSFTAVRESPPRRQTSPQKVHPMHPMRSMGRSGKPRATATSSTSVAKRASLPREESLRGSCSTCPGRSGSNLPGGSATTPPRAARSPSGSNYQSPDASPHRGSALRPSIPLSPVRQPAMPPSPASAVSPTRSPVAKSLQGSPPSRGMVTNRGTSSSLPSALPFQLDSAATDLGQQTPRSPGFTSGPRNGSVISHHGSTVGNLSSGLNDPHFHHQQQQPSLLVTDSDPQRSPRAREFLSPSTIQQMDERELRLAAYRSPSQTSLLNASSGSIPQRHQHQHQARKSYPNISTTSVSLSSEGTPAARSNSLVPAPVPFRQFSASHRDPATGSPSGLHTASTSSPSIQQPKPYQPRTSTPGSNSPPRSPYQGLLSALPLQQLDDAASSVVGHQAAGGGGWGASGKLTPSQQREAAAIARAAIGTPSTSHSPSAVGAAMSSSPYGPPVERSPPELGYTVGRTGSIPAVESITHSRSVSESRTTREPSPSPLVSRVTTSKPQDDDGSGARGGGSGAGGTSLIVKPTPSRYVTPMLYTDVTQHASSKEPFNISPTTLDSMRKAAGLSPMLRDDPLPYQEGVPVSPPAIPLEAQPHSPPAVAGGGGGNVSVSSSLSPSKETEFWRMKERMLSQPRSE